MTNDADVSDLTRALTPHLEVMALAFEAAETALMALQEPPVPTKEGRKARRREIRTWMRALAAWEAAKALATVRRRELEVERGAVRLQNELGRDERQRQRMRGHHPAKRSAADEDDDEPVRDWNRWERETVDGPGWRGLA